MTAERTALPEVMVIDYGDRRQDNRGTSLSLFDSGALLSLGISFGMVTAKLYRSDKAGTVYGIHMQKDCAKLVYCVRGRGLDYAVDLRRDSENYLKWVCTEISAENGKQVYIPKGFGHVFVSLEDGTENVMCCDGAFRAEQRVRIRFDDPDIGIEYPDIPLIPAQHDTDAPLLKECENELWI